MYCRTVSVVMSQFSPWKRLMPLKSVAFGPPTCSNMLWSVGESLNLVSYHSLDGVSVLYLGDADRLLASEVFRV